MEESTQTHMETDVSSTTADIPDTQEVTGSDGNVEMIIVVEKMDDEPSADEVQQLLSSEETNNALPTQVKPAEKESEVVKCPTTSAVDTQNKSLDNTPTKSPTNTQTMSPIDSPTKTAIKSQTSSPNNSPAKSAMNVQSKPTNIPEKPTTTPTKSATTPAKSATTPEKSATTPEKSATTPEKSATSPEKSATTPEKSATTPEKSATTPEKSATTPAKSATTPAKSATTPAKSATVPAKSATTPAKSAIDSPSNTPTKFPKYCPIESSNDYTVTPATPSKLEIEQVIMVVQTEPQQKDPPAGEAHKEAVGSSIKDPLAQSEDTPTIEKSTEKDAQKPDQKSPVKEQQSQASVRQASTKDSIPIDKTPVNGKVQSNDTNKKDDTGSKNLTNSIDIAIETSNDSQVETLSDISEKEHKNISRELKSLIKSAKESKIISECTQLTSKTRKSRTALDTSSSSLNSSLVEPNKIHDIRRNSDISQKSNCSEKSDKTVLKRSMRSQNPEFVSKVKQFLNSVTGKGHKDSEEEEVEETVNKAHLNESISKPTPPKVKKTESPAVIEKTNKLRSDPYCWRCHWAVEQVSNEKVHPPMHCTVCPRSFHYKCLTGTERNKINLEKNWVCPECMIVLQAESSETRSPAMKKITLGMLCELLKHALERMMDLNGVEPFLQPVDRESFPDYDKYVVHPMDLSLMRENINEGLYGSTEAFLADAQWILHNSIIFNTLQSKLTSGARALVRSCRSEMGEIEACPECYAAAHARRPTWFTDVCSTPHILFWAKLKGFPYWPAKGMSVNSSGLVDVRFFGAHDRAWVPAKDCFLYSEKDPNNFRTKRQDIIDSMQDLNIIEEQPHQFPSDFAKTILEEKLQQCKAYKEAEQHIRNISRKYGRFVYPPFKTQFEPAKMHEQLKMMIPTFDGEARSLGKEKSTPAPAKAKRRSNSKSSKSSFIDGSTALQWDSSDSDGEELQRLYSLLQNTSDISENEDTPTVALRKMADGAEIVKMDEADSVNHKDVIEVDSTPNKTKEDSLSSTSITSSRKRRRSELEEAIVTIIESSGNNSKNNLNEKRKRVEEDKTEHKKSTAVEPNSSKAENAQLTDTNIETVKDTQATPDQTQPVTPKQKVKDSEPSSSTEKEKNLRVTPIRIALVTKDKRNSTRKSTSKEPTAKIISSSEDNDDKSSPKRQKPSKTDKVDKTPTTNADKVDTPTSKPEKTPTSKAERADRTPNDKSTKEDRSRSEKRSSSRSKRSANSVSSTRSSEKTEKRSEKNSESPNKEKENGTSKEKEKVTDEKVKPDKQMAPKPAPETPSPKSVKDRLLFDDDTTLAVLARESAKSLPNNTSCLPTISCVRSLSTTAQNTCATVTKITATTAANTIDITEEATSDSSIFTPTSTENVKTMKDAVTKLQKLRNDAEPIVGRVGVRAFARMTSPERQNTNNDVQVEIKAEPIDLDEPERHMEKMDLMNAFRLRPVNPTPPTNLRDVRINKVVVTPLNARKGVGKPVEIRPRAKKTFPQPKKPDDGRSELNSKNSMVYIPIQPPMTQAPVRLPRPQHAAPANITSVLRPPTPAVTSVANNLVNTVTTPLMAMTSGTVTSTLTSGASASSSVASVPTVHTVPLMTSVNGQWMFSFQPVMSVGAIDNSPTPVVNGVAERGAAGTAPVLAAIAPGLAAPAPPAPSGPVPPVSVISRTSTESAPGEPPRLLQRPTQFLLNPLDASTPIGSMPPPSTAGPVTAKLNQNAVKMTDFFRTLLEESLEKLEEPASLVTTLKLQLEQANWRHQQEIKEVKHNHELTLAEMRASFEKEKLRAVNEARRAAQVELENAVKQAKSKQWCANCSQEAQFYCCWNTSYCDYPCQRAHWSQHFAVCQQRSQDGSNGDPPSSPENRLQPQPDMPKNTPAPTLTVGGKIAPTRVYAQDSHSTQKASIIVSMVEDTTGNQTMKCVGTYKPPSTAQMPIIINKQLMNNEENVNKKVVSSSGGYLIVGASNNTSVVTPARRTHTIQYYT